MKPLNFLSNKLTKVKFPSWKDNKDDVWGNWVLCHWPSDKGSMLEISTWWSLHERNLMYINFLMSQFWSISQINMHLMHFMFLSWPQTSSQTSWYTLLHIYQVQVWMCIILAVFRAILKQLWESLNRDSDLDLWDASAVFYQLSYQTNWEGVVICGSMIGH